MTRFATTIPDLFFAACAQSPGQPAIAFRSGDSFTWHSWEQLAQHVARCVRYLREAGLQRGDRLALLSENRLEWVVVDLACHFSGVISVPLHASSTPRQWQSILAHSAPALVVASENAMARLDVPAHSQVPVRPITEIPFSNDEVNSSSLTDLRHLFSPGRELHHTIAPDDIATILYTSGTTGEPKGVMLTSQNLAFNAQAAAAAAAPVEEELILSVLPLSHAYARTCDLYFWLARRSRLALSQSRETLLADLQSIRPTTLHGVPYLFARLQQALLAARAARPQLTLAAFLGGRVRSCSSGGAALPEALYHAYHSAGVPLYEGYGLTETSPIITLSTRSHHRAGSCGQPLPEVELKIADDGEVLTRGEHVMVGYFRDAVATADTLPDGWLHTGDLGSLDADGFLHLQGRKKEWIVLATGRKIMPRVIEDRFLSDARIAQLVVVGEGRPHIAALISLHDSDGAGQAISSPDFISALQQHIAARLVDLSPHEQLRHIAIVPPLTMEQGELSAKLSFCRGVIAQKHAAVIDDLYRRAREDSNEPPAG